MTAANPMRGEAAFGEHKLIVNFNACCVLESETGKKWEELEIDLSLGLGFSELRLWIRTFLDKQMTLDEVGEMIGEMGALDAVKALSDALNGFYASQKPEKKARPPKAA